MICVEVTVNAPMEAVWEGFTSPEAVTYWCFASDDWHAPTAQADLRVGGSFTTRMEAKDGSAGFDFGGVYDEVVEHKRISYAMDDGRRVHITFHQIDESHVCVKEEFDADSVHSEEVQREGWQAILNNFKSYVEK